MNEFIYFGIRLLMQVFLKKHGAVICAVAALVFCFGFYFSTFANALHVAIDVDGTKQVFGSGTFGDAFGAANAAFTGLALMGLVLSIILQRRELSIVKDERRSTQQALQLQIGISSTLERDLELGEKKTLSSVYLKPLWRSLGKANLGQSIFTITSKFSNIASRWRLCHQTTSLLYAASLRFPMKRLLEHLSRLRSLYFARCMIRPKFLTKITPTKTI